MVGAIVPESPLNTDRTDAPSPIRKPMSNP